MTFEIKEKLWQWQGQGAWYFVSIPKEYYPDLKEISLSQKKGFGSLKVELQIGHSIWKTSIFPDNESKTFLLPIKKAIRTKEKLNENDLISIKISLLNV